MWYAVTKREHRTSNGDYIMAGVVFAVSKSTHGLVKCTHVHGVPKTYMFRKATCKDIFTKPVRDLDSAIEESFMQSEANYC